MKKFQAALRWLLLLSAPLLAHSPQTDFDVIIKGGTVYDGTGGTAISADVAMKGDRIAAIGDLASSRGRVVVDARGLAVAPGFINMLSGAYESMIVDGRSQWENFYLDAGSPDRILPVGFKLEKLKPLSGKSLAEIAKMRGRDPVETIFD